MEIAPVLIAFPILIALRHRFIFTDLALLLIALHGLVLMLGGAYTYARVPIGFTVQDLLHLARNPYDRFGHLRQGFVPAIALREVLVRTGSIASRRLLTITVLAYCLSVSALYELIEFGAAVALGQGADAFLGTQGDPWDTQWDMLMCVVGAGLSALVIVAMAETLYTLLPAHPWASRAMARWLQSATAPVVSLAYVGLMVLAAQARIWKTIPALLAPVGQMAFTNYLAQSILMTILLYGGRGPGLFGEVDRPFLAAATAMIWLLQILWSRWWMARFTMGPLEWLWRLAYRGPMPLRRVRPTTTAATAA